MLVATCLLLAAASMARAQLVSLPADLSFTCSDRLSGFYADPLYDCQVFHICVGGKKPGSMLCPVGTAFSQSLFTCTWAEDADCESAHQNYRLNGRLYFQDEDPAVREALRSRSIEQVSSGEHPGKSLDPVQPVSVDPVHFLSQPDGLVAQDGLRELREQPSQFINNFDDSSNTAVVTTSSEEPIYVPSVEFTLPVAEDEGSNQNELLQVAENVQLIGGIVLPREGRSTQGRNDLPPTKEYLTQVSDKLAQDYLTPDQDSIPPTNDYLTPDQDSIPPTNDYLTPDQDSIPPTNDYLTPDQDSIPPTNEYLTPDQGSIPPTNDYLTPDQDSIPATNDYLTPDQDSIPPTNDYSTPDQDSIPPTNDYLTPDQDSIPPTNDYLTPDQDSIPPTNDYLTPDQDSIPPTNDYLTPDQDSIPPTNGYLTPDQDSILPTNGYLLPNEK